MTSQIKESSTTPSGANPSETNPSQATGIANQDLLLPYFAPYAAYVGLAAMPDNWLIPEYNYLARLILVPLVLVWAWKWYVPITGPKSKGGSVAAGIIGGLLGTLVWIFLLALFVNPQEGDSWTPMGFGLRLACASLLVPFAEELLLRGYVLRVAVQWDRARKSGEKRPLDTALGQDIEKLEPGAWTPLAVGISTLAFAMGHAMVEWPASIGYGLIMAGLWVIRKDLLSCIVAHGVTNFILGIYVWTTGQWGLW